MNPLNLAVISDLHIGRSARSKDLCPHNDCDSKQHLEDGYKSQFIKFINKEQVRADYLVIAGDVSDRAEPSEFKLASELIKDIASGLHVPNEKILFVPGNHDVDWAELNISDTTGFRRGQRYAPLKHPDWLFESIMRAGKYYLLELPYFSLWEFDDLIVAGYNSAWHDSPEIAVHHGLIADEHIREIDQLLSIADLSPARVRLFIVHHHPIQYSDPMADEPDFSAMTNAEKLLGVLRKYNFDLLIHGHKHTPNFGTYIISSSFPIAILGSGSFSAKLDQRWSGSVNNQFHVVKIEGRDNSHDCIFGLVESWTYLCGHGWQPSESSNGIRHKLPFGTYVQPHELKRAIKPLLEAMLNDSDYVVWSTVVSMNPHLKYLPPERVLELIDSLSGIIGFRRHGEPPDEVILLK